MSKRLALFAAPALAALALTTGCDNAADSGINAPPAPAAGAAQPPAPPDSTTTPKGPRGKAAQAGGGANMPSTDVVE